MRAHFDTVRSDSDAGADVPPRCPDCDYNLTGIDSAHCPECGGALDWEALTRTAAAERAVQGPVWERWSWRAMPVAFIVTCLQASVLPWRLAQGIPARARLAPPLAFLAICCGIGVAVLNLRVAYLDHWAEWAAVISWVVGAFVCISINSVFLGLLLATPDLRHPWRLWLALSCYLSYPLMIAGMIEPPIALVGLDPLALAGNIWPALRHFWLLDIEDIARSVLYWWWFASLVLAARARATRGARWRALLLLLVIPAATVASSWTFIGAVGILDPGWPHFPFPR